MPKLVVLGATSAIAEQVVRLFAGPDLHVLLVARNNEALSVISDDLKVRGVGKVDILSFDFSRLSEIEKLSEEILKTIGNIDILFVAYGTLPNQKDCEASINKLQAETSLNYLSVISVLTGLSAAMKQNKSGTIAVITSVAGDRGRKSNYVYGSAKGALTIFLQGLRNALSGSGVHVLTIKPGFVDTPMTSDFTKGLLWTQPEKVANDIKRAIDKKKNMIYTPWFWRWIMLIIRLIPESIFKKLNL